MAAYQNSEAAKDRKARKANFTSSEFAVLTEEDFGMISPPFCSDLIPGFEANTPTELY